MTDLFVRGELSDFLSNRLASVKRSLETMPEDEVLARSADDLVAQLVESAAIDPLSVGADAVDGGVAEVTIDRYDQFDRGYYEAPGFRIHAVFEFTGNSELLHYAPSTRLLTRFDAQVGNGTITVRIEQPGSAPNADAAKQAIDREIGQIRTMAAHSTRDIQAFNQGLDQQLRPAVENRKKLLQDRRDLAGALGFPLKKRSDAPAQVPFKRKAMGVQGPAKQSHRTPYRDEPALTEAQYEDAISVISSALLSMERTPSVVAGKDEEELRDYVLVMLNGTFQGAATGETFVKSGKTDILVRVEDRHVFVGECKWWKGSKALGAAIDQLLGYMPWRDEKAALIIFINNKDASAVFDKVDTAVRSHSAYKRVGASSSDRTKRLNHVLGHPGDPEREIQLAVLFAVLPTGSDKC